MAAHHEYFMWRLNIGGKKGSRQKENREQGGKGKQEALTGKWRPYREEKEALMRE